MIRSPCSLYLRTGRTTILQVMLIALGLQLAESIPSAALDPDEWTVVTLARDGSWGVGTADSQGQALAMAIGECRTMAAASTDCGAQFVTTRGGWVVAKLCGDHKIIEAADGREDAEQAAVLREIDLKLNYDPDLAPCRRMLTVDPDGIVLIGETGSSHQTDPRRKLH